MNNATVFALLCLMTAAIAALSTNTNRQCRRISQLEQRVAALEPLETGLPGRRGGTVGGVFVTYSSYKIGNAWQEVPVPVPAPVRK